VAKGDVEVRLRLAHLRKPRCHTLQLREERLEARFWNKLAHLRPSLSFARVWNANANAYKGAELAIGHSIMQLALVLGANWEFLREVNLERVDEKLVVPFTLQSF